MTPDVCGGSAAICLEEWRDERGGNKGSVGMGSVRIESVRHHDTKEDLWVTVEMCFAARRQSRQFVRRGRGRLTELALLPNPSGVVVC